MLIGPRKHLPLLIFPQHIAYDQRPARPLQHFWDLQKHSVVAEDTDTESLLRRQLRCGKGVPTQ